MSSEDRLAIVVEEIAKQNQEFQHRFSSSMEDLTEKLQQHDAMFKLLQQQISKKTQLSSSQRFGRFKSLSVEIDLAHFDGTNVDKWLLQAEKFFDHYELDDNDKVQICSFHMTGTALAWYKWMRRNRLISTWPRLVTSLRSRFGLSNYRDLFTALIHLNQTGGVSDYVEQFAGLSLIVDAFSESTLVTIFIGGLKSELRRELSFAAPTSFLQASELAIFHEERLELSSASPETVLEVVSESQGSRKEFEKNLGNQVDNAAACLEICIAPDLFAANIESLNTKSSTDSVAFDEKVENPNSEESLSELIDKHETLALAPKILLRSLPIGVQAGETTDVNVERKLHEPSAVFSSRMNTVNLVDVFDPGGQAELDIAVLEFSNESFVVEASIGDMLLGIDSLHDRFVLNCSRRTFDALVNHLFERVPEHCEKCFKAVAICFLEVAEALLVGETVRISKIFIDYCELLSWLYDLEDKVDLMERVLLQMVLRPWRRRQRL